MLTTSRLPGCSLLWNFAALGQGPLGFSLCLSWPASFQGFELGQGAGYLPKQLGRRSEGLVAQLAGLVALAVDVVG